jgi:hypothetical protein
MPTDYIPPKDSSLIPWANNFAVNIDAVGAEIGLSGDMISAAKQACSNITSSIMAHELAQKTAQQTRAAKDAAVKAGKKQLRKIARSIKSSPDYAPSAGAQLGIFAHYAHNLDPRTYQPRIRGLLDGGQVAIKFYKKGVQGVNIYTRLKGESIWGKLSFASRSPFVDSRPLAAANNPEAREYMAMGVIADKEFGQASKIINVLFGG